jgi:hypothetical protein
MDSTPLRIRRIVKHAFWLVCASKVYSGLGADIVYGIITLIDLDQEGTWRYGRPYQQLSLIPHIRASGTALASRPGVKTTGC